MAVRLVSPIPQWLNSPEWQSNQIKSFQAFFSHLDLKTSSQTPLIEQDHPDQQGLPPLQRMVEALDIAKARVGGV